MLDHDANDGLSDYQIRQQSKIDALDETRKKLREEILVSAILDKEKTEFSADFDGCGDSGNVHAATGNDEVDKFLIQCVNLYVSTDWYNGDGGGGDITWKVFEDKIIINSYYNEMVSNDDMVEAEF